MRRELIVFINGVQCRVNAEQSQMTVAEFLRYRKGLTGTKIVCAEGDCGACSILVSRYINGEMTPYKSINSCISFMYLNDCSHIITVEGLGDESHLDPVQEAMVNCYGAQCGYCTPGFICAMASLAEDAKVEQFKITKQKVKNYLTGNLCRCTGYEPIIEAGMSIDLDKTSEMAKRYDHKKMKNTFSKYCDQEVQLQTSSSDVYLPKKFDQALKVKDQNVKMISGGTDLGVLSNKRKVSLENIMSFNNLDEAYKLKIEKEKVIIWAKVSLDTLVRELKDIFPEFINMLHIFASPQIKNSATLVGNIINASPISDTIPFLRVANAKLTLSSQQGEREVDINDFFLGGYKQLDLKDNEVVKEVTIFRTKDIYKLYKVSIRKDLDISTVTFAASLNLEGQKINGIQLAFGGVGPVVLRAQNLERKMHGHDFSKANARNWLKEIRSEVSPLSDLRGSDQFRYQLCENLFVKFFDEVLADISNAQVEASL